MNNTDKDCHKCPFSECDRSCVDELELNALDLINRQQAEIERLQNLTEKDFEQTAISTVKRHQKWIEYRAIKEFVERLKETAGYVVAEQDGQKLYETKSYSINAIKLDNLVKEMVGEE